METSAFAYDHVLRRSRGERAFFQAMRNSARGDISGDAIAETRLNILSPLVWLYHMIIRVTVGERAIKLAPLFKPVDFKDSVFVSKYSRETRKFLERNGFRIEARRAKIALYIETLFYGRLTPTQKQEKQARMSGLGRIHVYGLIYWVAKVYREACLAFIGCGTWAVPACAATDAGLWDVQLPPN